MKPKTLLMGALVGVLTSSSQACSVCIAHAIGAGLQALGAQTLHPGITIIGLTYSDFTKSNAGDDPGTTESEKLHQWDLGILHGLSPQLMLRADIPMVNKKVTTTGNPGVTTHGLGDISLGLTYQVKPKLNQKVLWAVTGDLKLPTGDGEIKDSTGTRLDQHSQIGTGSKDGILGVVATTDLPNDGILFAGLSRRWNGRNKEHYHYGDAWFYNLGYSHAITDKSAAVLEFNGRIAEKDSVGDGTKDDNSGGHFGYASLSYRQSLGSNMGLVVSYQLPVLKNLNGTQRESRLISIGLSILK